MYFTCTHITNVGSKVKSDFILQILYTNNNDFNIYHGNIGTLESNIVSVK
jgi:hypothetical protein